MENENLGGLVKILISQWEEITNLRLELAKAKESLEQHGFVDNGGQYWKPPIADITPYFLPNDDAVWCRSASKEVLEQFFNKHYVIEKSLFKHPYTYSQLFALLGKQDV